MCASLDRPVQVAPLKKGEVCKYGPHVPMPNASEKQRPEFKRMEALHGTWEPNKFKYKTNADAGEQGQADASPAKVPAMAGRIVVDDAGNTPVASPR